MDPRGKVAVLTGGARIGRTVASALAQRGCDLAITWRSSRDAAEETALAARAAGVKAETFQLDAADESQVSRSVASIVSRLGRLDILVNMASTYTHTPIERLDAAVWQKSVDSDARTAWIFSLAAVPRMLEAGAGRIINFTDWLPISRRPRYPGYAGYYVAKSAVAGITEAFALELAPTILVNAVAPGPILPPSDLTDEEYQAVVAATPLKRWGGPGEIAKAVIFLIETDFMTGECLRIDGGRHLR